MDSLTTSVEPGSPAVLHVKGEIDLATVEQLQASLQEALAEHTTLLVDMAEVTFVDAVGLRTILQVADSLNGRRPLVLLHASRVARLLQLVGLTDVQSIEVRGDH